jgi:hypothetical protein
MAKWDASNGARRGKRGALFVSSAPAHRPEPCAGRARKSVEISQKHTYYL